MNPFGKASRKFTSAICAIALLVTSFANTFGQATTTGRALTHQDYDSWHSIQSPQISRDGKFVAYTFMAQDGDSEVVVRNLVTGAEWRAPRGYRAPAPPPDDSIPNVGELIAANARLVRPFFTADSRSVVFGVEPTKAEVAKAKKEKKKPEDMPRNAMGIMDTSTGQVTRIERVKSFQVPEDGSGFIAYLLEAKPVSGPSSREAAPKEPPAETSPNTGASSQSPGSTATSPTVREGAQSSSRSSKKKDYGSDLILRNTTSGTERTFNDALDYSLSKDARTLVFAVSSKKEDTNGLYAVTTQTDGAPAALLAGKGKYLKPTWDEDQTELAFISDHDDDAAKQPKFKVYLWNRNSATVIESGGSSSTARAGSDRNHATIAPMANATEVVSTSSPGFRKDFVVSDKATLGFSLDGSHLWPTKKSWSICGTGKTITFSQCRRFALSRNATDPSALSIWLKIKSLCSSLMRRWNLFHLQTMAAMQSAPTTAPTES